MISTRISLSKKISRVSWQAEAIYTRIIPHADDGGRFTADLEEFRGTVIPLGKRGKQVPTSSIRDWLEELHRAGLIVLYSVDGDDYLVVVGFDKFQTFKSDRDPTITYPEPDAGNIWNPEESNGTLSLGLGLGSKRSSKSSPVSREYTPSFLSFWNTYPRKEGKFKSSELWQSLLDEGLTEAQLIGSAERYAQAKAGIDTEFLLLPATFLGPQRRFEDFLPPDPAAVKANLEKRLVELKAHKEQIIQGREPKDMDPTEIDHANDITIQMRGIRSQLAAMTDTEIEGAP